MQAQDYASVVRGMFDAINKHDMNRVLSFVDPNVDWTDIASETTYHGQDGVKALMQRWWNAFPDNSVEITDVIQSSDKVVVEYIGRGTNQGSLEVLFAQIPPTNRCMETRFCDVYEIRNGKIAVARAYYDMVTIMRQLGLTPMAKQTGA